MTRFTIILIFIATVTVRGQGIHDGLVGVYQAKDDSFEKYSILTLQGDKRFVYEYGVGGCRGEVKGTWDLKEKKLTLTNDKEFLQNKAVVYPDMSLISWTIRTKGIKPNATVDSGCVKEKRIHLRKK